MKVSTCLPPPSHPRLPPSPPCRPHPPGLQAATKIGPSPDELLEPLVLVFDMPPSESKSIPQKPHLHPDDWPSHHAAATATMR
jgi:hypothetical protein